MSQPPLPGQRGPSDHTMHARVIATAHARFRSHGFAATSVADIAADLEVAPTYLYKFFRSKNAIGEAVSASILEGIQDAAERIVRADIDPRDKILGLFATTLRESVGMFFADRKLHDLVSRCMEEDWASVPRHKARMRVLIRELIVGGMEKGTFDAALDVEEATDAVFWALYPFSHPSILEQTIDDDLGTRATTIARFCLRALCAKVMD